MPAGFLKAAGVLKSRILIYFEALDITIAGGKLGVLLNFATAQPDQDCATQRQTAESSGFGYGV